MKVTPIELAHALDWASQRQLGTLITLRRDGRPQSSDVHHSVLNGAFVFSVLPDRAKVANVERDPRVVYHVSHEGSYVSFDSTAEVSPVATDTHGPAMDTLIDAFRAVAGKEHPDWDEFRSAMVAQHRRVITITPSSAIGLIDPVWG